MESVKVHFDQLVCLVWHWRRTGPDSLGQIFEDPSTRTAIVAKLKEDFATILGLLQGNGRFGIQAEVVVLVDILKSLDTIKLEQNLAVLIEQRTKLCQALSAIVKRIKPFGGHLNLRMTRTGPSAQIAQICPFSLVAFRYLS